MGTIENSIFDERLGLEFCAVDYSDKEGRYLNC
jgi:hypothetical protein